MAKGSDGGGGRGGGEGFRTPEKRVPNPSLVSGGGRGAGRNYVSEAQEMIGRVSIPKGAVAAAAIGDRVIVGNRVMSLKQFKSYATSSIKKGIPIAVVSRRGQ